MESSPPTCPDGITRMPKRLSWSPIPQGRWQMTGDWYNKKPRPGMNIMNLTPMPGNSCFATTRDCDTFRLHGDSTSHPGAASEGCIILPPNRIDIPLDDAIEAGLRRH